MSFEEPIWLYLLPIVLMLFVGIITYGLRKRTALLSRFAAERLLGQLTEQASLPRTWIKSACIILAAGAITFALSRPQLGVEWTERKARGLDIVFIIDASKSMLATDLRPTRLERAKLAVIDLVERLESDRIGLVAFAGQAFLQTPPTLDYSAFRESLNAVSTSIMTSGGSNLGFALEEAAKAFPTENNVKVAVLLTDGEDLGGQAIASAEAAREDGIQIFAIGIGTPEGEYLRIENDQGAEEFVRDSSGQPVLSKLDEETLQQIAQITGGSYSRLSSDSLDQLYESVIATLPREERESELQEIHIERFQWAIGTAVALLLLDVIIRRRRNAAFSTSVLAIAALSFTPNESYAEETTLSDPRELFNAGYQALSSGDYEQASEHYEASIASSSDLALQGEALYNMGHIKHQQGIATYQSGDPQGALDQIKESEAFFESSKELNPDMDRIDEDLEKIREVREMIEQLLEQQQEQEQQDQDQEEDSENSEQDEQQDQEQSEENESSQDSPEEQDQESQENSEEQQNEQESSEQNSEPQDPSEESSEQDSQSNNSEQSSSDQTEESQQETDEQSEENSEQSQSSPSEEESTQEPEAEPSPELGSENENGEEETDEQSAQPQEGEEGSEDPTQQTGISEAEVVEGMSAEDAATLLDSLRSRETLLPFIDQQGSGRQRDVRDW